MFDEMTGFEFLDGEVDESAVSLRFWGDSLVPDAVTQVLGIQPHIAFARDESLAPGMSPAQPTGMWMYWIERSDETSVEEKILQLFEQLPQDLSVWNGLNSMFNSALVCGFWLYQPKRDQMLSAATMLKIGQRGLALYSQICFEDVDESW